ncbi:MAG: cysteine desulfurase [Firmicutes bacterium]|nr:cysteine desulfurase [Bacillota bacterium]
MTEIYLDNSATTRPFDEVIELLGYIQRENYGNPASLHARGVAAEKLINEARHNIASLLRCRKDEIFFTSGGTESNNLALKGAAYRHKKRGSHIITTQIEHPSVLNCCRSLEKEGFIVDYLPVNSQGYLDLAQLSGMIGKDTILVSTIHVNNEIGTIQPLGKIGEIIKERNPQTLYHIDGVQSFAKIPASLQHWKADLYSFSSHKIHGPKGVGALWVRKGVPLEPLFQGGGQEKGLRPGTENTACIAGFGLASRINGANLEENKARFYRLKELFYRGLQQKDLDFYLNGPPLEDAAPHIINLSFPGIKAEVLLHALEEDQIYVSSGSACHSRHPEPSHVLAATGIDKSLLSGSLRFSFSSFNDEKQIDRVIERVVSAARELSYFHRR